MADFDIDEVLKLVEMAVSPFPRAALFELFDDGHTSAFEQLVACMISIRTRDEVMLPVARELFKVAATPAKMAELAVADIDKLIARCSFHGRKAEQIWAIAQRCVMEFNGRLPCDRDILLSFSGVGPKCANLVMGIACNDPQIGVDIHVHRIANRWGYVQTKTPEKTMAALEAKLPRRHWVPINKLLVPFGKHICTGRIAHCSRCPLDEICPKIGL
ncbi:MAG: endonuclease III [Chloroflexota bacterium]